MPKKKQIVDEASASNQFLPESPDKLADSGSDEEGCTASTRAASDTDLSSLRSSSPSSPQEASLGSSAPSSPQEVPSSKMPVQCNYYQRGTCTKGTACRFAHGDDEFLAAASTQANLRRHIAKTQLCSFFKVGRCLSGPHCLFAHGDAELRGGSKALESAPAASAVPEEVHSATASKDPAPSQVPSQVLRARSWADTDSSQSPWSGDCCEAVSSDLPPPIYIESDGEDEVWAVMPWWTPHAISEEPDMIDESFVADISDMMGEEDCEALTSLESAKVHRWDAEHGQWIVEFIDIELPQCLLPRGETSSTHVAHNTVEAWPISVPSKRASVPIK